MKLGELLDNVQQRSRTVQAGRELGRMRAEQRVQPGGRPAVRQPSRLCFVPRLGGFLIFFVAGDADDQRTLIHVTQLFSTRHHFQALAQQEPSLP